VTVILAIANQQSGAGKTVTAANVAAGFARAGRRTLAVDCDAWADLTRWLLGRSDRDAADLSKPNPNKSVTVSPSDRWVATFMPMRQANAAMNSNQPHW
jgi:cellulose biosynthesis protein BcsQ